MHSPHFFCRSPDMTDPLAEVVTLLHQTRYALAFGTALLHVAGSLLLTIAGYHSATWFLR